MQKVIFTLMALGLAMCGMECSAQTVSGHVEGHDYVDLGLPSGTKWATCNVGATKPTEYGDYFLWGETKPKEDYTYKWGTLSEDGYIDNITKYNTDSYYGIVDNKTVLESADDAASVNWGGAWRMPTLDEIKELIDGCTWDRVEDYMGRGVNGQVGASKTNGNTIFLPAAGRRNGTDLDFVGDYGYYWSSSLDEDYSTGAYYLYFLDGNIDWSGSTRGYGRSVRAVTK